MFALAPPIAAGPAPGRADLVAWLWRAVLVCALAALPLPAAAQLSASLAVESDYRLRGRSISEGRPAALAQLGYDHPSGLYLNILASLTLHKGEPRPLGTQLNLGYSRPFGPDLSIDAGLLRADYRRTHAGTGRNYTEAYLGLRAKAASVRLFYSPDYLRDDVSTLYGELEGVYEPAPGWRLGAHLGLLTYLGGSRPYGEGHKSRHDWRVSLSRPLGGAEIHAALSGGGPGEDYYCGRYRASTALAVGASWAF